jgi:hypothetical protein
MRTCTCISLLSLLAISLSVDSALNAYRSTGQLQSATLRQLVLAKTQQEKEKSPPAGSGRRSFIQSPKILTYQG